MRYQTKPWMRNYYSARQRCLNKKSNKYPSYGGRGIEFRITPEEIGFIWERDGAARMVQPTIDRIDSDGHYEFANCRFIEQRLNGLLGGLKREANLAKIRKAPGSYFNKCKTCGKEVKIWYSEMKAGRGKFCSLPCRDKAMFTAIHWIQPGQQGPTFTTRCRQIVAAHLVSETAGTCRKTGCRTYSLRATEPTKDGGEGVNK